MNGREWALIAFTLLAQSSVGTFLALGAIQFATARGPGPVSGPQYPSAQLGVVVALLTLGAVFSLFHLGQPLTAWLSLANLRRSWLSREILLVVLFGGGATALWLAAVSGVNRSGLLTTLWTATALCGAGLVAAMAQVYRLEAQPSWNTVLTPVSFLLTTAVLGAAAAAGGAEWLSPVAPLGAVDEALPVVSATHVAGVAALVCAGLVLIELVLIPLSALNATWWARTAGTDMAGLSPTGLVVGASARVGLLIVASGLMSWTGYNAMTAAEARAGAGVLGWTGVASVVAAEVVGRWMFYGTRAGNPLS